MEEDAGKSTHPVGTDYSLVDLNRAGTPLLEIVSEPEIHSPEEAKAYAHELWLLMRYAGVSEEDVVILPAFGVTVAEMLRFSELGCTLVDTTCGSVLNVWKNVIRFARDGAFEGQTVAVLHFYTQEGFDFSLPKRALKEKGFSVYRWMNTAPSPKPTTRSSRPRSAPSSRRTRPATSGRCCSGTAARPTGHWRGSGSGTSSRGATGTRPSTRSAMRSPGRSRRATRSS